MGKIAQISQAVHLDAWALGFLQAYTVEAAKLQAAHDGLTCTEEIKPDGTITLRIHH